MKKITKNIKRFLALVLCVAVAVSALPQSAVSVKAEETTQTPSGTDGNLSWEINQNGTLIISGEGEMKNYYDSASYLWSQYKNKIYRIVIEDGVTSIGRKAFANFSNLEHVYIPDSVETIYTGDSSSSSPFYNSSSSVKIYLASDQPGENWQDYWNYWLTNSYNYLSYYTGTKMVDGAVFSKDETTVYAYMGDEETYTIPEGVTSIGYSTFRGCSSLREIGIPEGVTSIGSYAFRGCSSLREIDIPEGVTTIGNSAFYYCSSLREISIPEGVTTIGYSAFDCCSSLREISIPEGVTTIGNSVFRECSSLREISIPEGVTTIGEYAFYSCDSLAEISIPEGVTAIGEYAFYGCSSLAEISIPEGVTAIGNDAFYDCSSLTEISIPEGVTTIGYSAFYCCSSLREIIIPEGVTAIANYAFYGCSSLTEISIPKGATTIGRYAFYGCSSLAEIIIPEGVTTIGESAFSHCSNLKEVIIPEGVTTIGNYAFGNCDKLTSIYIPNSVEQMGYYVFYNDKIRVYCESASELSGWDSRWDDVNSGKISVTWNSYRDGDFVYLSSEKTTLTGYLGAKANVKIPDGVTTIQENAFGDNTTLRQVYIPASVTTISASTSNSSPFYGCTSIDAIFCEATEQEDGWGDYWSCSANQTADITYDAVMSDYMVYDSTGKVLKGYFGTETEIVIPEQVTEIGASAFYGCSKLRSITLPEGVTTIGNSAFRECSSLTEINIPEGVTVIDYDTFYGCSSLTEINLPEGVKTIGDFAFYGCSSLTEINIPEGVNEIADYVFYGCSKLAEISLPESITTIGIWSFCNCSSLTKINIPGKITTIEESTFDNCSSLREISLPEGVTTLGEAAFSGCSSLMEINFPERVTTLGEAAFLGCSSLTEISLPEGVTTIGNRVFVNCDKLTSICIPDSVGEMGYNVFFNDKIRVYCESSSEPSGWDSDWDYVGSSGKISVIWDSYRDGDFVYQSSTKTTLCGYLGTEANVVIPDGVTTIQSNVFGDNAAMRRVYIPASVQMISASENSSSPFYDCEGIEIIYCEAAEKPEGWDLYWSYSNYKNPFILYDAVLSDDIVYDSSRTKIKGYLGTTSELVIPDQVKVIGQYAFSGNSNLTKVTLPEGLTGIEEYAFYQCSGITELEIPDTVTEIGASAFSGCTSIETMAIPDGVTVLKDGLFAGDTSLAEITLPQELTSLGKNVFDQCIVETLELGAGLTAVDGKSFGRLSNIKSITFGEGLETLGANTFKGVTTLESVNLPEGTKTIGDSAFSGCTGLKTLEIPSTVTAIGASAFSGCTGLEKLEIPSTVTTIGASAFCNCVKINVLYIPESVDVIGAYAFQGDTSLRLYCETNEARENWDPEWNALDSNTDSSKVPVTYNAVLEDDFIYNTSKTSLLHYYGNDTSVTIPSSVTSVAAYAFSDETEITNLIIPDHVTYLGANIVQGCSNLVSISIKNSSVTFAEDALNGINAVVYGYENSTTQEYCENNDITFIVLGLVANGNCGATGADDVQYFLYQADDEESYRLVIEGSGDMSDSAYSNWAEYKNSITEVEVRDGVTGIGNYAFSGMNQVVSISLPDSIESIGGFVFEDCTGLTELTIPPKTEYIGSYAFDGCTNIKSLVIPESVSQIGSYVFHNCEQLESVTFENPNTKLGTNLFEGCDSEIVINGYEDSTIKEYCEAEQKTFHDVSAIEIGVESVSLEPGETSTVNVKVFKPSSAVLSEVSVTDSTIVTAKLTADGKGIVLKGEKTGKTVVTVTGTNGVSATCEVEVEDTGGTDIWITEITLNKTSITMEEMSSDTLTAAYAPANATNTALVWSSSNEEVATVDNGVVYGVKPGVATITVLNELSGVKAECAVTIVENDTVIYHVTFDGNGGEVSTSEVSVAEQTAIGTLPVPTRTGYDFVGWYTDPNNKYQMIGSTYIPTEDMTLYAHWSPMSITVNYNGNGGATESPSKQVSYGGEYGDLETPVRTGYTFEGWYTDAVAGDVVNSQTKMNSPETVTIYAHWRINSYILTYNANGGSVSVDKKEIKYNSMFGELPTPTRAGYLFTGWYTSAQGGSQVSAETRIGAENQEIFAQWCVANIVTFDGNGGEVSTTEISVAEETAIGTLPVPTRTGYNFVGWYTDSDENIDSTYVPTEDMTLYAHWSPMQITVKYNANGGATAYLSKAVSYGEKYGVLETPVRTGYTFEGWYTDATAGNLVNSQTKMTSVETVTIYAHWRINSYVLTYNANGGSVAVDKKEINYNSVFGELPTPTRAGYQFTGWYTAAQGGSQVSAETRIGAENQEIFAQWRAVCVVTFDGNGGDVSTSVASVAEQTAIGTLPVPTRTGYNFVGWYTDPNSKDQQIASTYILTKDIIIYAHWSPTQVTVNYNGNGGAISSPSKQVIYDGEYGDLETPIRSGYIFEGWYTDATAGNVVNSHTKITSQDAVTIYAHWRPVSIASTKLSVKLKSVSSTKLTWRKVANVEGYVIYRATSKKGKYSAIKTVSANTLSYTDQKLKSGKTYYYKVVGYKKDSTSANVFAKESNIGSKKIIGAVGKPKLKIAAQSKSKKTVTFSWGKIKNAKTIEIYTRKNKGKWKKVKTLSGKKTKGTISYKSWKRGNTYWINIRASYKVDGVKVVNETSNDIKY